MTPTDIKFILDLIPSAGVPVSIGTFLLLTWWVNRGKIKDPMIDLRSEINEVKSSVNSVNNRLIKVETRQEMILSQRQVQHWNDHTQPPT